MSVFGELRSKRLIVLKGLLFLALGILAAALLLLERPDGRVALLLATCVWAFCRFYFFAFYVIERWVDPQYRFTGLVDLVLWLLRRRPPWSG